MEQYAEAVLQRKIPRKDANVRRVLSREWLLGFPSVCLLGDKTSRFQIAGVSLRQRLTVQGEQSVRPRHLRFLPQAINKLVLGSNASRGNLPVGVCFHKGAGKYVATMTSGSGRSVYLGLHQTPEAAFLSYKAAKEPYIRQVAELHRRVIDARVYEVSITD